MRWSEKPYNNLAHELKRTFGERLYKIPLNAGLGCPNRDGTLGSGGCIFCSEGGSGDFAGNPVETPARQLDAGIAQWQSRHPGKNARFIAYYQAFTNTYAPAAVLKGLYAPALAHPDVALVSIATRPDCLDDDVLDLLSSMVRANPLWVELGLQTASDRTAEHINRGYFWPVFETAVRRLHDRGIGIVAHVILGLPGENLQDVLATISALNRLPISGIKLHLLHVLEGTALAGIYREGAIEPLSLDTYTDWVCRCIAHLRPDIVIHRLTGDGPKDLLLAPAWSADKRRVLNRIHQQLKALDWYQGCLYEERTDME